MLCQAGSEDEILEVHEQVFDLRNYNSTIRSIRVAEYDVNEIETAELDEEDKEYASISKVP
jgi:hypothetical protein